MYLKLSNKILGKIFLKIFKKTQQRTRLYNLLTKYLIVKTKLLIVSVNSINKK